MNSLDIVLVKGTSLISEIIEDVSNSAYSHTAIYVGINTLIEADGFQKTGYVPISKYTGMYDVYRYEGLTKEQEQLILNYLVSQIGGQYDYLLLINEFIRYVFHIILPFKESFKSHICSTLIHDAFKSAGIELCPGIKHPSPGEISKSNLLKKIQ